MAGLLQARFTAVVKQGLGRKRRPSGAHFKYDSPLAFVSAETFDRLRRELGRDPEPGLYSRANLDLITSLTYQPVGSHIYM